MLWWLPGIPALAAVALLACGCRASRAVLTAAVAAAVATLAVAALAVTGGWTAELAWGAGFTLTARLDPVSSTLVLLVPAVAAPVLLFAARHEARQGLTRLVVLLTFFVAAMELLVIADDLLTLLLGWELVGACSWALIGHHWRDAGAARDAATAFLVTRFGDLGLFLAAMVTFGASGSFTFEALGSLNGPTLGLAVAGLLVAAAAKSAQFPFSFWLFTAMSGPSSVSALLHAATMVAAGAYLVARLHPMLDQVSWFASAAMTIGLLTALLGGVVAVLQPHVKKVLAASTSAHFGLMLVAAAAGYPVIAVLHLVAHGVFKSLLFMAAGVVSTARHTHLLAFLGRGRRLPWVAVPALAGAAALAGLPPFGAAWTKELIGTAAGHHGKWLAAAVLLAGALSAVYVTRWQWLALGPGEWRRKDSAAPIERATLLALGVPMALTLLSMAIWITPVHAAIAGWFGSSLPAPAAWERVTSALLLGSGLYVGAWLARNRPLLGRRGPSAAAADWLGVPLLTETALRRPVVVLATMAARFDDRVLDASVMLLARSVRRLSRVFRRADHQVMDAPVRAAASFGCWLGARGTALAEALADGAVEGTARLAAAASGDATRLQTGLAHHYLAWLTVGAALLIAVILAA